MSEAYIIDAVRTPRGMGGTAPAMVIERIGHYVERTNLWGGS
jgi:hypothetical protein